MSYDLGTAHGKIELEYEGRAEANQAERDIDKIGRKAKDTDSSLARLGKTLAALGKGAAIGGLAIGLTNAAVGAASLGIQLLGVVPALASLSSLASALPGMFVAGVAGALTLQAAFAGVGDTLKAAFAADPAKFNKALEKLSPEAQKFARSFREQAVPALKDFQQSVQEAFFKTSDLNNITSQMPGIISRIRPSVVGLSTDFGRVAKELLSFATSNEGLTFIQESIIGLQRQLAKVTPTIQPLLSALTNVGTVGVTLMDDLGTSVANVSTRFANFLNRIVGDGSLEIWINDAIETLGTLGSLAGNVGSILSSVFRAAEATGGGLLQTLEEVTGQFAAFLRSTEGTQAITSLFSGILDVARQLVPVITTLAGALARALGPALSRIATEVGPILLDVVNRLSPAFAPLANAIASVVSAVAPLLPPLAELVSLLAGALSAALSSLAAELGPVINLFGNVFADALQTLSPALTQLATGALPLAAQMGTTLLRAFAPLAPIILKLAQAIASAIIPVLPQLQSATAQLIPVIGQLATAMAGALGQAILRLIPLIPPLVGAFVRMVPIFVSFVSAGLRVITFLIGLGAALNRAASFVLSFSTGFIGNIVRAMQGAYNAIVSFGPRIIAWFQALPGRAAAAVANLGPRLQAIARAALHAMAFAIGAGIGLAVNLLVTFPRRAGAAVLALGPQLVGRARAALASMRAAIASGINNAIALKRTFPLRAAVAINSLGPRITSIARSAFNSFRSAIDSGIGAAARLAATIPGRIRSAVGNLGGLLAGAGRDAVNGLINGLRSGVGAAAAAARSLGSSIAAGIRSTLKIGSPSRVMIEFGMFVGKGLVIGLEGMLRQVRRASESLANTVIAPTVQLAPSSAVAGFARPPVGRTAGQAATSTTTFHQTVNALPGMSARSVGDYALNKLTLAIQTGVGAVALPAPSPQGV